MRIKNRFLMGLFALGIVVSGYAESGQNSEVQDLFATTDPAGLSVEQKADAVIARLKVTPEDAQDEFLGEVLTMILVQDPENAPQIIASMIKTADDVTARKIVAHISVLTPLIGQDVSEVIAAIQMAAERAGRTDLLQISAEELPAVIDIDTVTKSGNATLARLEGDSFDSSDDFGVIERRDILPVEVVGYGGQTAP